MERVPFYGLVVGCMDDPILRRLLPRVHRRVTTYGMNADSNFRVKIVPQVRGAGVPGQPDFGGLGWLSANLGEVPLSHFSVTYKEKSGRDKDLGEFSLHVPGVHNVLNATAAIAVGTALDIAADQIRTALSAFRGVDRRFQVKGKAGGVTVIDDYGHHPTEIRATLAAARQCGFRRVHVIFQPHRYTRTRDLMEEFATAFADADTLQVLDIYAASEKPIEGVTGAALAQRIAESGKLAVKYAPAFVEAASKACAAAEPGDMILTLGAGSVSQMGPMIVEQLGKKSLVVGR